MQGRSLLQDRLAFVGLAGNAPTAPFVVFETSLMCQVEKGIDFPSLAFSGLDNCLQLLPDRARVLLNLAFCQPMVSFIIIGFVGVGIGFGGEEANWFLSQPQHIFELLRKDLFLEMIQHE